MKLLLKHEGNNCTQEMSPDILLAEFLKLCYAKFGSEARLNCFVIVPPNQPLLISCRRLLESSKVLNMCLLQVLQPYTSPLLQSADWSSVSVLITLDQQLVLRTPPVVPIKKALVETVSNKYTSPCLVHYDDDEGMDTDSCARNPLTVAGSAPSSVAGNDVNTSMDLSESDGEGDSSEFELLLRDPARFDHPTVSLPRALLRVPARQTVPVTAESLSRLGLGHLSLHRSI